MKMQLTNPDHRMMHKSKLFGLMATIALASCASQADQQFSKTDYVDPFIGTGFHGHTFPGPTMPFGMVQLSPDTHIMGWDASSGYHYGLCL